MQPVRRGRDGGGRVTDLLYQVRRHVVRNIFVDRGRGRQRRGDAHDDRQPNFLRMDNRYGGLCNACHRPRTWAGSAHAVSSATWSGTATNKMESSNVKNF